MPQSIIKILVHIVFSTKDHHSDQDFQNEFRALCRIYDVEIDERYCWD